MAYLKTYEEQNDDGEMVRVWYVCPVDVEFGEHCQDIGPFFTEEAALEKMSSL